MKLANLVMSGVLLFGVSCARSASAQSTATDQGVEAVEVIHSNATVEQIDLPKRKVTLLLDTGKSKTFKVDKSVENLDQVKVGDKLKMAYTEELVILVGHSNQSPAAAEGSEVGVAPKGAKPGIVMVDTTAVSAKILSVDAAKHRVTIENADGKKKTVKLGSKITNLETLKPGETVDMVLTDSLVVEIVK
ncbi:MAG: hypothetical protein WA823_07725 [Candidatus Acidiferrales bacterium]